MRKLICLILFALHLDAAIAAEYPILLANTNFSGSRFYVPNSPKKRTSIVILHGSEGGSEFYLDSEASTLAMQGYPVLVLCYFDCNRGLIGPRETLMDKDPSVVLSAIEWLRKRSQSNGRVVVYGFSRGAELALLVGSLNLTEKNQPSALIAHAPSNVVHGPWNWNWHEPACWICTSVFGCSVNADKSELDWNKACAKVDPRGIDKTKSAWTYQGVNFPNGQRIEAERFDGPILITVGLKDEVWPVEYTQSIETSLNQAGRKPEVHYFQNSGHVFYGNEEIKRRKLVLDFIRRLP